MIRGWYVNLRLVVAALVLIVIQMQPASDGWFNKLVGVAEVDLSLQWTTFSIGCGSFIVASVAKLLPVSITVTIFETMWAKLSPRHKNKVEAFFEK